MHEQADYCFLWRCNTSTDSLWGKFSLIFLIPYSYVFETMYEHAIFMSNNQNLVFVGRRTFSPQISCRADFMALTSKCRDLQTTSAGFPLSLHIATASSGVRQTVWALVRPKSVAGTATPPLLLMALLPELAFRDRDSYLRLPRPPRSTRPMKAAKVARALRLWQTEVKDDQKSSGRPHQSAARKVIPEIASSFLRHTLVLPRRLPQASRNVQWCQMETCHQRSTVTQELFPPRNTVLHLTDFAACNSDHRRAITLLCTAPTWAPDICSTTVVS